jgi:hypothetical protein
MNINEARENTTHLMNVKDMLEVAKAYPDQNFMLGIPSRVLKVSIAYFGGINTASNTRNFDKLRKTKMGNQTKVFFEAIGERATNTILDNIAGHYGISRDEAYAEVTDNASEHLLDYVTGPERAATSVLMQRHGFGGAA